MRCKDCRYFDAPEGANRGFCRMRAPVYHLTSTPDGEPMPWTCWPEVNGEDWCGEGKLPPQERNCGSCHWFCPHSDATRVNGYCEVGDVAVAPSAPFCDHFQPRGRGNG